MDAVSPITDRATLWRLGHMIDAHAETAPGSTALIVGDQRRRITYADLAQLVVEHCAALLRRGLYSGDVVALRSSNSIEFVVALLGAARAGIVVATLDPALPWTERRARMDRVGARVVLTDARRPDPIGGEADCPEWCLHITTSGAKPEMRLLAPDPGLDAASPLSGLTDDDALIMFTSGTTGSPKLVP
jgi:acyl-CoA synthetase (AMP-forming)/AMP-acid ligase II